MHAFSLNANTKTLHTLLLKKLMRMSEDCAKQVAQLSQRNRAVGWVSFGQK